MMIELYEPARFEKDDWLRWVGRVPGTQTSPEIPDDLWDRLVSMAASRRPAT
ncbi:MAG: hypothetical protein L0Y66_17840 [Myxococcaceae bacterium]|nr:hypothetical protein [Myxococcaceae bacterium]